MFDRSVSQRIAPLARVFIELAYGFATLCVITTATRIWWGWKAFQ